MLPHDASQARHSGGGCLPGFVAYTHIVASITGKRWDEKTLGILKNGPNVVTEIWIGPKDRPTWTIVQRHLRSNCGRILATGLGYYFDINSTLDGLPL